MSLLLDKRREDARERARAPHRAATSGHERLAPEALTPLLSSSMSSPRPRPLLLALALAFAAPLLACGGAPLGDVRQVPPTQLEIVQGDRLLATTQASELAAQGRHQVVLRDRTYEGVRLRDVLRGAGVDLDDLRVVEAYGADGYRSELTRELALADSTLVVDREAGQALSPAHGPLRLIADDRAASTRALRRLRVNP